MDQSVFVGVFLNQETVNKLTCVQGLIKEQYEGNFCFPTTFHVTMDILSENWQQADIASKAIMQFEKRNNKQFELIANKVNWFNDTICWIGVDNYLPLQIMKNQIREDFKNAGFNLKQEKFDEYVPHITMGYDVKKDPNKKINFKPIPFIVDNISLHLGFKTRDEYINNLFYQVKLK